MALRKEDFGERRERAGTMGDNQQINQEDRISVEIDRKLYRRIKVVASKQHMAVNQYLEQLLDEVVPEDDEAVTPGHPITQESLDKLKEMREKLFQQNNYQHWGNSVEDIRKMREERTRWLMGEGESNE